MDSGEIILEEQCATVSLIKRMIFVLLFTHEIIKSLKVAL